MSSELKLVKDIQILLLDMYNYEMYFQLPKIF